VKTSACKPTNCGNLCSRTNRSNSDKKEPPRVAFHWGVFRFAAVITNMTQKFTLFMKDGTPVRAKVDITFTQYNDVNDYPAQNPTSGGGPVLRTWQLFAATGWTISPRAVYGDATKWRQIAEYNNLDQSAGHASRTAHYHS
jgi:hypothetical protein